MSKKQNKTNNLTKTFSNNNLLVIYIAVFASVIVLITAALFTYAYLTDVFESPDNPAVVGNPQVQLFEKVGQNYVLLNESNNFTLTVNSTNTAVVPEIYVRNTGDIDTLVMLNISVHTPLNEQLLNTDISISNPGWVNVAVLQPNTYATGNLNFSQPNVNNGLPHPVFFNSLLNSVLEPSANYTNVFNSITLPTNFEFGVPITLVFSLQLEAIAYSGNPYQFGDSSGEAFDSNYEFSENFLNNVWTAWK